MRKIPSIVYNTCTVPTSNTIQYYYPNVWIKYQILKSWFKNQVGLLNSRFRIPIKYVKENFEERKNTLKSANSPKPTAVLHINRSR